MQNQTAIVRSDDLTCQELVELVTDYLEAALSPRDRARFEQHVVECEGCQNYLEQMRQSIRLSAIRTTEPVPAGARKKLLEHFQNWKKVA